MKNPLIVALDVDSAHEARRISAALAGSVNFYKVGLELYAAAGMPLVQELIAGGNEVFLDLKLYDIGETVKRAVTSITTSGVRFLTVHARGQVMRAAVQGRGSSALKLLGVTVLTSYDDRDLAEDGYAGTTAELVDRRVRTAVDSGIDGIVCSPLEIARVRRIAGPAMTLVIPGVRSHGADTGDQKRVATPAQAIADGADYLVIGRQVTRASDPQAEVERILDEIQSAAVTPV